MLNGQNPEIELKHASGCFPPFRARSHSQWLTVYHYAILLLSLNSHLIQCAAILYAQIFNAVPLLQHLRNPDS